MKIVTLKIVSGVDRAEEVSAAEGLEIVEAEEVADAVAVLLKEVVGHQVQADLLRGRGSTSRPRNLRTVMRLNHRGKYCSLNHGKIYRRWKFAF